MGTARAAEPAGAWRGAAAARSRRGYSRLVALSRTRSARASRRRQRRLRQVEHDLTEVQWHALTRAWGGCASCGATDRPLQRDCVLPISRGGRYTVGNVVPACASCNTSKCNAEVTGWLRRKRLDEQLFLTRLAQIQHGLLSAATDEPGDARAEPASSCEGWSEREE